MTTALSLKTRASAAVSALLDTTAAAESENVGESDTTRMRDLRLSARSEVVTLSDAVRVALTTWTAESDVVGPSVSVRVKAPIRVAVSLRATVSAAT